MHSTVLLRNIFGKAFWKLWNTKVIRNQNDAPNLAHIKQRAFCQICHLLPCSLALQQSSYKKDTTVLKNLRENNISTNTEYHLHSSCKPDLYWRIAYQLPSSPLLSSVNNSLPRKEETWLALTVPSFPLYLHQHCLPRHQHTLLSSKDVLI